MVMRKMMKIFIQAVVKMMMMMMIMKMKMISVLTVRVMKSFIVPKPRNRKHL